MHAPTIDTVVTVTILKLAQKIRTADETNIPWNILAIYSRCT